MLDKMRYINHIGEVIEFGKDYLINTNDFRNYEWAYNSRYNKIVSFRKHIVKKTLPVLIEGSNAYDKANRLFEVIEKDVLEAKSGCMEINGYKLKGYFYASKKKDYTRGDIIKVDMSFVSDSNLWIKESEPYYFNIEESATDGLDYNHDYAYDYTSSLYTSLLSNPNYTDTDFRITISGKAVNPSIVIAGHTYAVDGIIEEGENLFIDSIDKTVYLIRRDGAVVNKFGDRDKDSYIFQKIPSGGSSVSWGSDFAFSIVLIEQRSEPRWN